MDLLQSTLTLAGVITIGMFVLGILTYFSNKKRNETKDSEEDKAKVRENEARLVKIEALLVSIEKNTSNLYIKVESHDKLLTRHEADIKVLQEKVKKGKY